MLYYLLFYLERIPGMKYDKNHALLETAIPGLPPPKSGKVRILEGLREGRRP